ncbi:hypothetical protein MUK42_13538, partial [Musa troglodytarum]
SVDLSIDQASRIDRQAEKGNLCLYAFADETWEVRERPEKVPTEFPELVRGINLARDVTEEKRWLADVACHSDAWRQLFVMINALPTISEVLLGAANTSKDGPSSKKDSRRGRQIEKDVIEVDDDDDDTCGVCWKTHRQGGKERSRHKNRPTALHRLGYSKERSVSNSIPSMPKLRLCWTMQSIRDMWGP